MAEILTDLSLAALAQATEANWREGFLLMLDRWKRGEVEVTPELVWFRSDVAEPLLNSVLTCRLGPAEAEERIAALLAGYRERGLPLWWWIFPSSLPQNLGALLERQGLVREEKLPGMGVDLALLPSDLELPEGFRVERVLDRNGLLHWADTFGRSFPAGGSIAEAHCEIFAPLVLGEETGWSLYLGLLHGRPVATSAVYRGAGVAGLYYVYTLSEARGRGIGKAMVVRPLVEARAVGYRGGILQATAMGRPLYERLGFRDCIAFPQYRLGSPRA